MPSRTPFTPGRLPCRLSFLLRLPQDEIEGILFLILSRHKEGASARLKVIQIFVGKLSIIFEFSGPEVDCAVFLIGVSFLDQSADHLDHAADLLCGKRIFCGRLNVHALPYPFCTPRYIV